jgi:uncharacterized protein (TIGR02118 family)
MLGWQFKLIKALAFIHKKHSLSIEEFQHYYETKHSPLAKSLLTFESYERNYTNRDLDPSIKDLGSISIFKYESEKSLEVVAKQMSSPAGDMLREDELNFMNVPLNFYVFTSSSENQASAFQRKIFYIAKNKKDFNMLESQIGLKKISDNLVSDHNEIIGIPEHGITQEMQAEDLKIIAEQFPGLIFTNSFS